MPVAHDRLEILQICKLLQCIHEKDYDQIGKLVQNGIPLLINYNEPNSGEIPLGAAAATNDEDLVKFLLDLGAHPDVKDFEGRTALMRAAEYGHEQCFKVLLDAGTDMKAVDLKGRGVLNYCIQPTERHSRIFAVACANGADVNNCGKDGKSVFFVACEASKENEAMCLALLENNADPRIIQEATGRSPLMAAAACGTDTVMRLAIQKGADPHLADKLGRTAAHEAAAHGHLPALMCLAGAGVNFDVYDNRGNNPIHLASIVGAAMCCKFLGQRGCNPKAKNQEGDLPRVLAKERAPTKEGKECIRELRKVERTFGKSGSNNDPSSLQLYDFACDRQDDILESLYKVDADKTGSVMRDEFLDVLRILNAPLLQQPEGEEFLQKKVLPMFDKNRDGRIDYKDFLTGKKYINKNYLRAAFEGKKKKKKKGGKGGKKKKSKPPMEICIMPEEQIMRTLDGGPPVMYIPRAINASDTERFNGENPPKNPLEDDSSWYMAKPSKQYISMNDAAKHGDLESIKKALELGYHIDTRDRYYKTPLMVACLHGNLEMAKALIAYGANVNVKDNFHWTPLHHAAHAGMIDVVELLVNNGAQIDALALNGATPLYRAIESSSLQVVQFLVTKGAKINHENRRGANPMDVAYFFGADPRVHEAVKTKVEAVPTKKGAGKSAAKGGGAARGKEKPFEPVPVRQPEMSILQQPSEQKIQEKSKMSLLQTASALSGGFEMSEDITYCVKSPWIPKPSFQQMLKERGELRDRFGWERDFDEFQMPFQKHLSEHLKVMGGEEE